jgi:hypothetical protein
MKFTVPLAWVLLTAGAAAQTTTQSTSTPPRGQTAPQTRAVGAPWIATFGGPGSESPTSVVELQNGRVQVCGQAFVGGGLGEGWVTQFSPAGVPQWQLELGGTGRDKFAAMVATADGGSLVAGFTASFGAGGIDGWLVKLDAGGALEWQKTYGGTGDDQFTALAPSPNGYYVGGALHTPNDGSDVWLLEVDTDGNVLWQETMGGERDDLLRSLVALPDGFAFIVNTASNIAKPLVPFSRPWLVRMDPQGSVLWQKTYNFSGGDGWGHLLALEEGGFVVSGEVLAAAFFRGDAWVVRLDDDGNVVWDRRFGDHFANWVDSAAAVQRTPDGGFLVAGSSGTITAPAEDIWLFHLSPEGEFEWDEAHGDTGADFGSTLIPVRGGGFVLAGFSSTWPDALVMRLTPRGRTGTCAVSNRTSAGEWTSPLAIWEPTVTPTPAFVLPVDSTAVPSYPPNAGGYVCSPP